MKKFVVILVLGLFWCNVGFAGEMNVFKKKCEKLKLDDLGYSCSDLKSQTISKIDTIDN